MTFRTRFAPSPTGPLHLGHAYSALLAFDMARAQGGDFLLRIEDIDQTRARPAWEAQIYDDLAWLGITWPTPVMRQSDRQDVYAAVLDDLWARGLLYPCSCTRTDIAAAASAPQEGVPPLGPDGLIYPGTCRTAAGRRGVRPRNLPLRLDIKKAVEDIGDPISFIEEGMAPGVITTLPETLPHRIGDIVLSRRDMDTSYHLSVVADDADQGITHVVRGHDLFEATTIHVLLQRLLDLPTPVYHHHRLVRDDQGKRLAKRDDARALSLFRADGKSPQDILSIVGI